MNRSSRRTVPVAVVLALALTASACSGGGKHAGPTTTGTGGSTGSGGTGGTTTTTTPLADGKVRTGANGKLALLLSKGQPLAALAATPVKLVTGTDLGPDAVAPIVARLSPWVDDATLPAGFRWPSQTLPAPRAGTTVAQAFPSPAAIGGPPAPVVTAGDLEVRRVQPSDDVAIAPFVTVSFNQPMVPVSTVDQVEALTVPATITPAIAGHWRWLGTQTLRFDADQAAVGADRLPMATEYTVTIPAGTTSALGGKLASAKSFTFRTPPVTVLSTQPVEQVALPLDPVLVLAFDQRVDPAEVVKHVKLTADGDDQPVRIATAAEIAARTQGDAKVAPGTATISTDNLVEGRWIAVTPGKPLPPDAAIELTVGKGTPSAEGPRTTDGSKTYRWHTYAPLRVTKVNCGDPSPCPPTGSITVEFVNELDAAKFDPATVVVRPELAQRSVSMYGNVVQIGGVTKPRTTYEVTLPAGITDVYGQTLGKDETRKVEFGASRPILEQFPSVFTTLDPLAGSPSLTIGTVNHDKVHLQLFAVTPTDWAAFQRYLIELQQQPDGALPAAPWRPLVDRVVDVDNKDDTRVETRVDLGEALGGDGLGHLVALVAPTETYDQSDQDYWPNRPTLSWVQATKIGFDAFADNDEIRAWITDLGTGAPRADVAVSMLGPSGSTVGARAVSDGEGVARLTPPPVDETNGAPGAIALLATSGDDVALLSQSAYFGSGWSSTSVSDEARWYVVDDRHTYRPGETVSVKGFVRRFEASGDGQLHLLRSGTVRYEAFDAQGVAIGNGQATLNPLGGFDFTLVVPLGANQGPTNVSLTGEGFAGVRFTGSGYSFAVQEFRRPEYEVVTRTEGDAPAVSSRPATLAVDANYYAGGPVGAAPVTWTVSTSTATYAPPGWNEFSFGVWTPWWIDGFTSASGFGPGRGPFGGDVIVDRGFAGGFSGDPAATKTYTGTTGADGSQYLQIGFRGVDGVLPDLPQLVRAQASVQDVNRQVLASTTDLLVHPADFYVGLRGKQTFVKEGDPIDVDAIVTAVDGKAVAGRALRVTASRSEWTVKDGQSVETQVDVQTCDQTSTTEPVPCSFKAATGGQYTITATVADDHDATSRTTLTRWVSGGLGRPDRSVGREQLTVVPARDGYAPGDTAEVLVQAPFADGHGIVTIARVGIDATQSFDVVDGTAVVRIPLAATDVPGVNLSFDVAGTTVRTGDDGRPLDGAPARPAVATGSMLLKVSTASRALKVTAVPRATTVAPGQATTIDIAATGADGAPAAGAELAVAVVDEAVLALGPYRWSDPMAIFYAPPFAPLQTTLGRESITLVSPQDARADGDLTRLSGAATTAAASAAPRPPAAAGQTEQAVHAVSGVSAKAGGLAYAGDSAANVTGGPTAIDTRTNFDALAVFRPTVPTDAGGKATVDVTLPDNLTRYRVMVVAVQGDDRFGAGDAEITARKALMLRPSAPRFLNFGDTFELPVVVQNQTDQAMTVDLALQLSNLATTGAPGRRVDVPANDRVEVRFPVSAAAAGTGRFRVAAVSGDAFSDAVTVDVPVYTPVTQEAFATYGVVDDGVTAQPLLAPTGVIGQFGGLDVTTSSTALQGLTDALLDVTRWSFDSVDARASRILAITSLRGVLGAFSSPDLPSDAELDATVRDDIAGIVSRQNGDGGFGFWAVNRPSDPYVSVQAAHALVVARGAGFNVPANALPMAQNYLASIESYAAQYSQTVSRTLSAYALHVRALAGDRDVAKAEQLWRSDKNDLAVDAMAWLWPVIDDQAITSDIARRIGNAAVETAGAATFTTNYGDDAYVILASDRRTDAVVLGALIAEQPASDLIPKVVTGLLSHRDGGHWQSIQEDSFVLQALKTYFDTYERQTPSFVARVWLGDRYAGEQSFAGRSTDRLDVRVPTSDLVAAGNTSLVVSKEGAGRLYYRIGLTYAPSSLRSEARDRGFVVQRTYEAVDDAGDVRRGDDGVWHVKAGARVRVRLTMVAETQRTHVALVDPLPAGLEIANPALATTPDAPPATADPGSGPRPVDGPVGGPVGGPVATAAPVGPGGFGGFGVSLPSWWYPTWFEHQNLRDDRAEAFANFLPAGSYEYTYDARATTPGTFVVPPTRAEQIYEPETFGRSASSTLVVDA